MEFYPWCSWWLLVAVSVFATGNVYEFVDWVLGHAQSFFAIRVCFFASPPSVNRIFHCLFILLISNIPEIMTAYYTSARCLAFLLSYRVLTSKSHFANRFVYDDVKSTAKLLNLYVILDWDVRKLSSYIGSFGG